MTRSGVVVRHASVRTSVGTCAGSRMLASSNGVDSTAADIGSVCCDLSCSDATQHWSACDWLGWWCDVELGAAPSCIGHLSLPVQHAMRASEVGDTAAHRAIGPAMSIMPSDAASTRRKTLLTDLACSAATPVSNPTPFASIAQVHRWHDDHVQQRGRHQPEQNHDRHRRLNLAA